MTRKNRRLGAAAALALTAAAAAGGAKAADSEGGIYVTPAEATIQAQSALKQQKIKQAEVMLEMSAGLANSASNISTASNTTPGGSMTVGPQQVTMQERTRDAALAVAREQASITVAQSQAMGALARDTWRGNALREGAAASTNNTSSVAAGGYNVNTSVTSGNVTNNVGGNSASSIQSCQHVRVVGRPIKVMATLPNGQPRPRMK